MNTLGASVRLVKGAYKEPLSLAFQHKRDVDSAFARLAHVLLDLGTYPAIATHDSRIIEEIRGYAEGQGHAKDQFEFQMLYGVRRDLQVSLVAEGYRVRVSVPFGREWFPYFMHQLDERPANVAFALTMLARER